ncbi:MAG: hypothetical protein ABSG59_11745 [Verrucomicrobiota bacterium]
MSVMFRVPKCLRLGGVLAFSVAVMGQNSVVPQGGEFSILGALPGDQVWPSISVSPSVGCIAWQANVVGKSGAGVGGALLNSAFGASNIFRVNKIATGSQIKPKVRLLPNGNIIFVWESSAAGTPDIYARWARGTSTKTSTSYGSNFYTSDIRVNTYMADQQTDPDVAALPDGSAIIVWQSYGQDGSLWGVYARKYKSTGAPATAKEFLVNQYTSYNQRSPAVAALANGNYVIAWISEQERYLNSVDVYARIFTAAGVAVTDEIAVNSSANPCASPALAPLADGGFTVVWAQKDLTVLTNGWDVWGRPFSAAGNPEAADFRVNTYLYGDQYLPKIAAGPSGSLVVWTSLNQDGSREGVFGRFLSGGTQVSGNEFQVNTTWISQQIHPAVAWNGVDHFLVVWSSFVGSTGFDLYGQAYVLNSSP